MLSGLLITLNILVCIGLIAVVLLQRSEGGAFGMGGGPTGLITARGAGDLLTRTTWILFGLFLTLSLALTLLGAHDRAASPLADKLRLQQANTNALNAQPAAPPPATNAPAMPTFLAPAPAAAPTAAAPAPAAATPSPAPAAAATPAKPTTAHAVPPKPAPTHAAAPTPAPATTQPAPAAAPPPPVLMAPPPAQAPAPTAPVTTPTPAPSAPAGNP